MLFPQISTLNLPPSYADGSLMKSNAFNLIVKVPVVFKSHNIIQNFKVYFRTQDCILNESLKNWNKKEGINTNINMWIPNIMNKMSLRTDKTRSWLKYNWLKFIFCSFLSRILVYCWEHLNSSILDHCCLYMLPLFWVNSPLHAGSSMA